MLKERIKKIYCFRHALKDMTSAQFKAKYAGSRLGIWWAVIIPLILALSINFVFNAVFKIAIPGYTIFVISGILPWLFFNNALLEATNSFVVRSSILKQSAFPREFIPLSSILANLLNFIIGFLFFLPLLIILNSKIIKLLPFLALIIILHFLFLAGLGLLFASLNIFFRDLSHFLSIGFMVWFWITPVFYSLDMLSFPYRWICLFNPMTYYIISYQQILFAGRAPSFLTIITSSLISFGFLATGCAFFYKKEPILLKVI